MLRELLRAEMETLHGPQIGVFKRELANRLPLVVAEAAKVAKMPAETAQDKNKPPHRKLSPR